MPSSGKDASTTGRCWHFGWCEFAELGRCLKVHGQPVKMEGKPLDVLLQLLEHPTQIVTKEALLSAVWQEVATTEQSLTTAIAKLRKAFGGVRDAVIVNESGLGYRMAVRVLCMVDEQAAPFPVSLQPGEPIPRRPGWVAVRRLNAEPATPVWLGSNPKTGEQRVYKFAVDGIRLRALQREVAVSRLLGKSLGSRAFFAVRILDWGFETPPYFIESDYEGPNLLEWSATVAFQRLCTDERVQLVAYIADGVGAAHELGLLHNDLKPANILIHSNGEKEADWQARVRIADFGIASLQDAQLLQNFDITDHGAFTASGNEQQGRPLGTAMYRAPELHGGGAPTIQGDVYALGVLLYQVVCGDFAQPPVPGWKRRIADPLLCQDIAEAANLHPTERLKSVTSLAERLHTLPARRQEALRRETEQRAAAGAEQALARARLRRPWVVLALCSLSLALLATLWSAHRARQQRDREREHADSLAAMYGFVAQDLLGQSNPYLGVAGSGQVPQQTLLDAIGMAVPQIDRRFAHQPAIAARLHESIADSLKSRTHFVEADSEYETAAQHYREAGGPLSQEAQIAELKRAFTRLAAMGPGSLQAAQTMYTRQEVLLAQTRHPSVELQTWQTLVQTGLMGLGPHPEQALPPLNEALRRAAAAPQPDPQLLFRLKNQLCGIYVRLGDGANLQRASQDLLAMLTRQHGPDSATLFPFQMYLEEAFYLQDKNLETIAQADRNFAQFNRVLGPENQLTLATLATRAAAEGQLQQYGAAVRDDLALYAAEQHKPGPSAQRLAEGGLNDAAIFECHMGQYRSGLDHARQVIRDTGPGPAAQPMFYNGSLYTVADCLLSAQEARSHPDPSAVAEAEATLGKVNTRLIAEVSGQNQYQGFVDLAFARAALQKGNSEKARVFAARAAPLLNGPGSDPYQQRLLARVNQALSATR